MITEKQFHKLVHKWCKTLKVSIPVLKRDNRMKYLGLIHWKKENHRYDYIFYYKYKLLKKCGRHEIIHNIFHELGHIKYPSAFNIKGEYRAERYSLNCLKKYFPKYYKKFITEIGTFYYSLWKKKFPMHYKAFKKLKEYKEM